MAKSNESKVVESVANGEPVNRLPEAEPAKKGRGAKKSAAAEEVQIVIPKIQPAVLEVPVKGMTPLLVCAWSQKAIRQILDKQMKKANRGKEAKDPQADYMGSLYVSTEGWTGIPASGIKGCLVNACRAVDGLPMTLAKRMIFVREDGYDVKDGRGLVRIYGDHRLHQGMVRIDNGGSTDIRFRAIYEQWSLKLRIEFLRSIVSAEQILNLVELAGYVEGLCEWRPGSPKSNTGDHGRFQINRDALGEGAATVTG